jgi:uncharacterized protein
MLILNRAEVARGELRVRGEIPTDHPTWEGSGLTLLEPVQAELVARSMGDSILVSGSLRTRARSACRRCLHDVTRQVDEQVDLLFAPLAAEEHDSLDGELYAFPRNASEIDLTDPLREQLLLRLPEYVVCRADCQGLCPQCGVDRNTQACTCAPSRDPGPWDALRNIKFD